MVYPHKSEDCSGGGCCCVQPGSKSTWTTLRWIVGTRPLKVVCERLCVCVCASALQTAARSTCLCRLFQQTQIVVRDQEEQRNSVMMMYLIRLAAMMWRFFGGAADTIFGQVFWLGCDAQSEAVARLTQQTRMAVY